MVLANEVTRRIAVGADDGYARPHQIEGAATIGQPRLEGVMMTGECYVRLAQQGMPLLIRNPIAKENGAVEQTAGLSGGVYLLKMPCNL